MISVIGALELGDWREALRILQHSGPADAHLAAVLHRVARAMSFRAAGDHGLAWAILGVAATRMLDQYTDLPCLAVNETGDVDGIPSWPGEVERLALPPRPSFGGHAELVYRSVRLIWREQHELSYLFQRVAERSVELTPATHILVLSFVEYMCWVRHDPSTWTAPVEEEPLDAEKRIAELRDGLRVGFLRSATDLRRLNQPAAGDMSLMVWNDSGRYNGVQRLAILELARRPAPPWVGLSKPVDCPARLSAVNAWQFVRAA